MILNYEMMEKVFNQIGSMCVEVKDQTFLVIGLFIRNRIDVSGFIFDRDALESILIEIYPE